MKNVAFRLQYGIYGGRNLDLYRIKPRKTDLLEVVEDSIRRLALPDSIEVSVSSRMADPVAWLDRDRIATMLVDLERNAVEAMPEGGVLSLLLEDDADRVTIFVTDTGKGISKEHKAMLFVPFFTTKPVGEGTGLGIPTAYSVVMDHGGDMVIESNDCPEDGPTGTRVTISLPRKRVFPAAEEQDGCSDNE